jgi:cell volume regulation protein A
MAPGEKSVLNMVWLFVQEFGLGAGLGLLLGRLLVAMLNNARFSHEGFYPVFTLAFALSIYAATYLLGGSGFLAVYMAAILVGNSRVSRRNSIFRFFDGLAWLSQIAMFLTLGLLVFPSKLLPVMGAGLAVSAFLMLVARPLSVFLMLGRSHWGWKARAFIGWVGLRGAVPIVLATYALQAGVPEAEWLFNVVFFTVLSSALLQGWSIPLAARMTGCEAPVAPEGHTEEVHEFFVPTGSSVAGKAIVNIGLPFDARIVLLSRNGDFLVPRGSTVVEEGDVLMVLSPPGEGRAVQAILAGMNPPPPPPNPSVS